MLTSPLTIPGYPPSPPAPPDPHPQGRRPRLTREVITDGVGFGLTNQSRAFH